MPREGASCVGDDEVERAAARLSRNAETNEEANEPNSAVSSQGGERGGENIFVEARRSRVGTADATCLQGIDCYSGTLISPTEANNQLKGPVSDLGWAGLMNNWLTIILNGRFQITLYCHNTNIEPFQL